MLAATAAPRLTRVLHYSELGELAATPRFLRCRPIPAGTMFPVNCSLVTVPDDNV